MYKWNAFLAITLFYATGYAGGPASICAYAAAADDAGDFAAKGAEAFKANQYLEAAQAFEKAAQLDPSDPKNLRYAGRAWQEVGHLRRALVLLEAYLKIEPDPKLRASIEEKIAPLRKLKSKQVAEALAQALGKYPQGRLEAETAKAYEEIGDEPALKRAAELWEVARVRAASDSERMAAETGSARVAQRVFDAKARREKEDAERKASEAEAARAAAKAAHDKAPDPIGATKPPASSAPILLYGAGGALVATGALLVVLGRNGADTVHRAALAHEYKDDYPRYLKDRASADTMYYVGYGAAAAGAGVLLWAFLVPSLPSPENKATTWYVLPTARGAVWGLQF
ncbi:MAG: hypothetical protein EXR77_11060 [Myxococcales bacterium]|nr:hypothetical protein [Myxococcales bacterium]